MNPGDRAGWLRARRRGITGTDVAAILGLNPWRTALDVYLEKIGQAEETQVSEAMWWGTYLEEGMARRYVDLTGIRKAELLRGGSIAKAFPKSRSMVFGKGADAHVLIRHRTYPFLLGTPDGLIPGRKRGLELKTAGDFAGIEEWGEEGTDQLPMHYLTQCAHYMAVTDFPSWDVGALLGIGARISGSLIVYTVNRNRALEAEITAAAVRFWRENVQKRIPPAIDGSASWQAYLAKKYSGRTGVVLKATPRLLQLADQYRGAQKRRQEAERAELLIRNTLASHLLSADKMTGPFGTIGWVRPPEERVVDWKAVARSYNPAPEQIARFARTKQDPPYVRAWWSRSSAEGRLNAITG